MTMNDEPLLPYSLRRNTDPDTSHEAAVQIMPHLGKLHIWTIECVNSSPGKTAFELSRAYCPTDPRRIGRRLGECAKLGYIVIGRKRPCAVTGRNARTWWPA